ncbi:MAG: hypothetical protein Kow0089_08920 [Desulfobulbaceae bacterium]
MGKSGKKRSRSSQGEEPRSRETTIDNTGNYLRTLRLGKGLSIKDVSEATRISTANITALEDQDFSSLPALTFTRGLLTIYANFLGADAETVVARFLEEFEAESGSSKRPRKPKKAQRTILTPKRLAEPTHVSSATMAGILLLIIVASFTGYCLYTSWNPFVFLFRDEGSIPTAPADIVTDANVNMPVSGTMEIITETVEEQPQEPAQPEVTSPDTEPAPEEIGTPGNQLPSAAPRPEPSAGPDGNEESRTYSVFLRFRKDSLVEASTDGSEPRSLSFAEGDTHTLRADRELVLTFSDPDSVEIEVNGNPISLPASGQKPFTLHIPEGQTPFQPDE